ncbi:hypothetical protein ACFQZZ_27380 [Nocardia sp. GCM10030253]|uniref:hypothetical protein n=1 Tax=Nocardia sp. GCM10030253 TaxID=3273404 RepID=UPI003629342A
MLEYFDGVAMPFIVWQDQGIDQFREIGGRLAAVILSTVDRSTALNQLTEAADSAEAFTDLLIEYSGRWFHESGGQSILIGPELFWMLSEPTPRQGGNGMIRSHESHPSLEYTVSRRGRKLLVTCVLEALAQSQWLPVNINENGDFSMSG